MRRAGRDPQTAPLRDGRRPPRAGARRAGAPRAPASSEGRVGARVSAGRPSSSGGSSGVAVVHATGPPRTRGGARRAPGRSPLGLVAATAFSRRSRTSAASSRQRSAICMTYWSRTSSSGCSPRPRGRHRRPGRGLGRAQLGGGHHPVHPELENGRARRWPHVGLGVGAGELAGVAAGRQVGDRHVDLVAALPFIDTRRRTLPALSAS